MSSDTASLVAYLEASAARFPDRTAVVDPFGQRLTYAELDERANRVAAFLKDRGVGIGDRVGVIARKSEAVITALFGIMKAGGAYVPADYTAPIERNTGILTDCQVKVAFLDPACLAIGGDTSPFERVVLPVPKVAPPAAPAATAWSDVLAFAPAADRPALTADDLAYILYTSGSTGVPKGVILSHRNATSFVDWCSSEFAPTEDDRFSNHAPFHFDLSVLDIYVCIKHGGTLFLVGEDVGKSPKDLGSSSPTTS
jgi:non-ribosomal peptide synthetase component F